MIHGRSIVLPSISDRSNHKVKSRVVRRSNTDIKMFKKEDDIMMGSVVILPHRRMSNPASQKYSKPFPHKCDECVSKSSGSPTNPSRQYPISFLPSIKGSRKTSLGESLSAIKRTNTPYSKSQISLEHRKQD